MESLDGGVSIHLIRSVFRDTVRPAGALVAVALFAAGFAGWSAEARSGGIERFRTPSGNILCGLEKLPEVAPVLLRCEIRSGLRPRPPRPRSCRYDWAAGYAMRRAGRPYVLCISDTVAGPNTRVLRYGQTWRRDVFTCRSRTTGLRCVNRSGHGFFLSRERSFRF